MKFKRWLIVLLIIFLSGCFSQIISLGEYTEGWIGSHIEEIRELVLHKGSYATSIGWKETSYKLDNGNRIYVEPIRPDCFVHWEVNPEGIIIGYRTEGKRCY